jgi:hypothetical protein
MSASLIGHLRSSAFRLALRSKAGCITNMFGFDLRQARMRFSVHTPPNTICCPMVALL